MEPLGAEVRFDLSQPLSQHQQRRFRDLFYRYRLLLFRGQCLGLDEQYRVMSYLGPLDPDDRKMPYVSLDDGVLGSSELTFHSDLAFVPFPPEALSLQAIDVEDGQTYTAFIDAVAGFERLPSDLGKQLRGAMTERLAIYSQKEGEFPPYATPAGAYSLQRPAIMEHPVTGDPILYIARGATSRIVGMTEPESRRVLDAALARLYEPEQVLRHYWKKGDFLVWDNLALQHARPELKGVARRILQRASMATHSQMAQMPANYIMPADMGNTAE